MDFAQNSLTAVGSELERLIAGFNWTATSMGPAQNWPAHVKSAIRVMLDCDLPMATMWGRDGVLIYNDAYAAFAGSRHPALLGAAVQQGWPEASDSNNRVLAAGLAGKTSSFRDLQVMLYRHGYPETIWIDLDCSPIRDDAGEPAGVLAVVRETTDRVQLERRHAADILELNATQLRQRRLVELGDRLRRCDTAGQISGAVAEFIGPMLGCQRAGYAAIRGQYTFVENDWNDGTVASLSGQHKFSALGPRYAAHLSRGAILAVPDVRTHDATAESAECWHAIDVHALLNVPLMENGVPVGMLYAHETAPRHWTREEVALVQDVADRTWEAIGRARAVEALRMMNGTLEAEVRERTLQRDRMWTLSTDLMMVSKFDSTIISVNPAWTSVLGWRADELIGRSFFDFLHPDDIMHTRAERQKLSHGQMILNFENRYRTKDGGAVWLSWKAVPDGDIIHSVARDVTAEREQAEALQAAEAALRHAQKMEAVGQLTGGIAHDFNNLLQGVLGALELVQKRLDQGRADEVTQYVGQARHSAERASALTHRLLAFSRRQALAPKPVEANALVLAMEPLLARTVGESIRLEFDLAADLWRTLCDPHQLDSAILNLAINARDAMPDGGCIVIGGRNVTRREPTRPEEPPAGEFVELSVRDTGAGIPPDVLGKVFEPFFTTKGVGKGSGLGLSQVLGLSQQLGGGVVIESEIGWGTVVKLYLQRTT
jgi:PAS domain S-box-containing protein